MRYINIKLTVSLLLAATFVGITVILTSGQTAQAISTGNQPHLGSVSLGLGYTGTPFGSSFWGQALPASTPINPNSAIYDQKIVGALNSSGPASKECYLETTGAPPIYVVPASQPNVTVYHWNAPNGPDDTPNIPLQDNVLAGGIPIPSIAQSATNNTDHTMIIYQPSTNTLWEMWQVRRDASGNWEIGNGGKITNASQSNGIFTPPFGTAATRDALTGVISRIEELQAGVIDHPVDLELPPSIVLAKTDAGGSPPANTPGATVPYSWPDVFDKPDGKSTDPNTGIPEGLRFRLDPSLNLSSLNLSPVAHTIAVAAQKYGFLVENVGPVCDIKLGNPQPYEAAGLPDPYIQLFGNAYGSDYSTKVMANFPWDHLQALPFNYGLNGTGGVGGVGSSSSGAGSTSSSGGIVTASGSVTITNTNAPNGLNTTIMIDGRSDGTVNGNSVTTSTATLTNGKHTVVLRTIGPDGKVTLFSTTLNVRNNLLREVLADYIHKPAMTWSITALISAFIVIAYTFGWGHWLLQGLVGSVTGLWFRYKTKDYIISKTADSVTPTSKSASDPSDTDFTSIESDKDDNEINDHHGG